MNSNSDTESPGDTIPLRCSSTRTSPPQNYVNSAPRFDGLARILSPKKSLLVSAPRMGELAKNFKYGVLWTMDDTAADETNAIEVADVKDPQLQELLIKEEPPISEKARFDWIGAGIVAGLIIIGTLTGISAYYRNKRRL